MPNINTAIVSLFKSPSSSLQLNSYVLILIFCLLVFLIFSQRILNIKSQYYILFATLMILAIMLLIICSVLAINTKLANNKFVSAINSIFDNPNNRNFLSVVSLILFVILVYELTEYDNNDPHYALDKIMFGHNKYISNRMGGILIIFTITLFVAWTIMTTTKNE